MQWVLSENPWLLTVILKSDFATLAACKCQSTHFVYRHVEQLREYFLMERLCIAQTLSGILRIKEEKLWTGRRAQNGKATPVNIKHKPEEGRVD